MDDGVSERIEWNGMEWNEWNGVVMNGMESMVDGLVDE